MESAKRRFNAPTPEGPRNLELARLVKDNVLNPPDPEWTRTWVGDHPWSWGNYIDEGQTEGLRKEQYFDKWGDCVYILTYDQSNHWRTNYRYVKKPEDCKKQK
jgi:hypothetical protein